VISAQGKLADLLAPDDARYVVYCDECGTAWPYQRDCKTTKATREGNATCPECGDTLAMARDAKADAGGDGA